MEKQKDLPFSIQPEGTKLYLPMKDRIKILLSKIFNGGWTRVKFKIG
jgi:hypothetical protein